MDIAMQSDADHYRILPEQELARGPLRLDFLVLLEDGYHMRSRFGRLLKKYTIIEYKGATDYLDIKNFFGGLAHAFQYLMSGTGVSGKHVHIPGIDEVLLMFVCMPFPKKLMDFLCGTPVTEVEPGVYRLRILGLDVLIVVQSLLEGDDYLWIRNLRRGPNLEEFNRMAQQAVDHPEDELRDSLIQFITEVNPDLLKEELNMCKVFEELEERGRKDGERIGEERGRKDGEERMARLIQVLLKDGRMKEISAVAKSKKRRKALYREYRI